MASEFNSEIDCSSEKDTWLKRRISSIRMGSARLFVHLLFQNGRSVLSNPAQLISTSAH